MGKPYSEDLRKRVLQAVDGSMTKMAAHRTFGVSRSTIDDWLALRERTGGVSANTTYGRGPKPTMSDEEMRRFARAHADDTLAQMASAWCEQSGQKRSLKFFSSGLQRIGWTRKKRVFSTANAIRKRLKSL